MKTLSKCCNVKAAIWIKVKRKHLLYKCTCCKTILDKFDIKRRK